MINEIYMIGWDEPDLEKNHQRACNILDRDVRLVSKIKGIHSAHRYCAENAASEFFWCIDGDNWLYDSARIDMLEVEKLATNDAVHVMRAKNPFNELIYGHGAIKLFPTTPFLSKMNHQSIDMTSGVDLHYKIVHRLTSEHRYNSSAFHTWRTAFRECVKLSSSIIKNQNQKETDERLKIWCDPSRGQNITWYDENHQGAIAGTRWGKEHFGTDKIGIINHFDKLEELFLSCYR